jgi:hypothetical protein
MSIIRSIRLSSEHPELELLLPIGVGLVLGASIALVPPWLALVGVLALVGLIVVLNKPILLLLMLVVSEATILPEGVLPVSAGPGTLFFSDLVLFLAFAIIGFRLLFEEGFTLARNPLNVPLTAFLAMAFLITLVRLAQSSFDFLPWAIPRTRTLLLLLDFFIVTNVVKDKKQLHTLLIGLLIIGGLVGLAMIAQFVLGESVPILSGRVEGLVTESVNYAGVTRVLPPGQSTVLVVALLAVTALVMEGVKPNNVWWLAVAVFCGVAVLLTFNRSFWGVVLMFIGMLFFFLRGKKRVTLLAGVGLSVLIIAGASLSGSARVQKLIDASLVRLETLFTSSTIEQDSSIQWREIETSYVWPAIKKHPLFGVGLGAQYRPLDTRLDWEEFDGRRYIHNAHLWIITNIGVFSYLIFAGLSVLFVIRGLRHWRQTDNSLESAAMLSFSLSYVGILVAAIVNPIFSQHYWVPLIGMMMGINETIIRLNPIDASADA